ncbi:MAG: hypothetical protein HFI77_00320 [Lachnospiraceae bacterium]|nr:hypothetical protein [Roseburia sp. 1XD42-69]MCI8874505.1 hypothetical protein [Lachnospiraceae bacterium]MCX4320260.1 hypothetical protein [Lachnospiraceae bacterium]
MKRLIGYTLFCLGVGMLLTCVIPEGFCTFLAIVGLMLLGYYLFSCGC